MRIAMLSPVAPAHGRGGVQDIVWSLARGLTARGHDVTLVTTSRGTAAGEERTDGVRVLYLEGTTPMRAAGAWFRRSETRVRALHAEHALDVIHSQSFCGVHLTGAIVGVPVVASLHGTHVDEIRTCARLFRESLATFALKDAARSVYVALAMKRRMGGEGALLKSCDAVIATSREQHVLLGSEYHVSEAKLFDVWNGIDAALFTPRAADPAARAALGGAAGAPLVLAVARLYQDKGIQHLLRAFAEIERAHAGARLAIVGDGSYRRDLEALAASLELGERVRFMGSVELDLLPAFYAAADVFVNPTVRINGYDLTILQAMSMARPVVVSNIGSVPTAVADGDNGFLVPPGDARALAATITRVLSHPARSFEVATRARQTVVDHFSVEAMVTGTLAVYERAIARCAGARPAARGEATAALSGAAR